MKYIAAIILNAFSTLVLAGDEVEIFLESHVASIYQVGVNSAKVTTDGVLTLNSGNSTGILKVGSIIKGRGSEYVSVLYKVYAIEKEGVRFNYIESYTAGGGNKQTENSGVAFIRYSK